MLLKEMNSTIFNSNRYIISDPLHFSSAFFSQGTVDEISAIVTQGLYKSLGKPIRVTDEQIKNVMDSVYESNPRIGLAQVAQMCVDYIVSYIVNEEAVLNQASKYDIDILNDTSKLQRFSSGQIPIKKKGPNRFGFHMIY